MFSLLYGSTNYQLTPPMINVILSSGSQEGIRGSRSNTQKEINKIFKSYEKNKSNIERNELRLNASKNIKKTFSKESDNKNNSYSYIEQNNAPKLALANISAEGAGTKNIHIDSTNLANEESGTNNARLGHVSGHNGIEKNTYFAPYIQGNIVHNQKPIYPMPSRKFGEEGTVFLNVYVLDTGQVQEIKIKKSSGYHRLDQAAINAVKKWKYVPAKKNNISVSAWHTQAIKFSLTD